MAKSEEDKQREDLALMKLMEPDEDSHIEIIDTRDISLIQQDIQSALSAEAVRLRRVASKHQGLGEYNVKTANLLIKTLKDMQDIEEKHSKKVLASMDMEVAVEAIVAAVKSSPELREALLIALTEEDDE